jgi:hypothetical protein
MNLESHRNYVSKKILETDSRGYLKTRESRMVEYKKAFNWANKAKYSKTMAAFANSKGGYIVFGINDKPRTIIGLEDDSFDGIDSETISRYLKDTFSGGIVYDMETITTPNGLKIGWIYTYESSSKPVICSRNDRKDLKDGAIYYRDGANSRDIKGYELQEIIYDRIKSSKDKFLDIISSISKQGVENVSILNLSDGGNISPYNKIILDEKLLSEIKIIKEGEFSEKKGAPTLKIVGEIESKGVIYDRDIDPEIKFPYRTKEIGMALGFPEKNSTANAAALLKFFNIEGNKEFMYTITIGDSVIKKYSLEALERLRSLADDGGFTVDKDSEIMKRIRKDASNGRRFSR